LNSIWSTDADPTAQGRIKGARPVAVLDIGSNSVRLVVYERHARALTQLYNEKASCALGRGVAATGRLAADNVERALTAIQRYALVAKLMKVGQVHILATSAVRDAENGADFVRRVEQRMKTDVRILNGAEEAHYAALGVVAGMPEFAGLVGDLGGGSLELSMVREGQDATGETYALGSIRLQDDSGLSPANAASLARAALKESEVLKSAKDGVFCAIGGTWRAIAKLHQRLRNYPLHMVQNYAVPADDLADFCTEIVEAIAVGKDFPGAEFASSARRDLIPYGAAVLGEVITLSKFEKVVFSALGVREGYLYGLLEEAERNVDPLMQGAEEMATLRSRSPAHAADLIEFTFDFIEAAGLDESADDRRLREAACYLSDIGWRGHPDYRGEQSVDLVAYGSLMGLNHPGRAFLAEVLAVRYMGLKQKSISQDLLDLAGKKNSARARIIGALFRVAYPMSAAMPGVLPRTRFSLESDTLTLKMPSELVFLKGERLRNRLSQLASVAGIDNSVILTG
jgi:exopolyphosphatase/guanosine-5'-triphosphate,3'-diphosphate pyrophosphatase